MKKYLVVSCITWVLCKPRRSFISTRNIVHLFTGKSQEVWELAETIKPILPAVFPILMFHLPAVKKLQSPRMVTSNIEAFSDHLPLCVKYWWPRIKSIYLQHCGTLWIYSVYLLNFLYVIHSCTNFQWARHISLDWKVKKFNLNLKIPLSK